MIGYVYDKAITSVRTSGDITNEFPITTGLHQGDALCSYLFGLVMDELTNFIQEEVHWSILFANDIVSVNETFFFFDYISE